MVEEKKEQIDKKEESKQQKTEVKKETKTAEISKEEKKTENKKPKIAKIEAKVYGKNIPISTKHAIAVCNFIRNMNIDDAIKKLELAEKKKIPVPMRGEIPHKKGIMSGRYPVNALTNILKLVKSLKSNAIANELELEKYKIFCKANVASRPYRRFGKGRFKRTHIEIKLIPFLKKSVDKVKK